MIHLDDEKRAHDEIAAAASGFSNKRFAALVRFTSVLVDQTVEAKLAPAERNFVSDFFKITLDYMNVTQQEGRDSQ